MSQQIVEAKRLPSVLEETRWNGGVRLTVQGSMRSVVKDGSVDLDAGWRADVFYGKDRKPAFVLIADTPAALLRDLAALAEGVPAEAQP